VAQALGKKSDKYSQVLENQKKTVQLLIENGANPETVMPRLEQIMQGNLRGVMETLKDEFKETLVLTALTPGKPAARKVTRRAAKKKQPQPHSVAGAIRSLSFDTESKAFELVFAASTSALGPTRIYASSHWHYPKGLTVTVDPPSTVSFTTEGDMVSVILSPTYAEGDIITVRIHPLGSSATLHQGDRGGGRGSTDFPIFCSWEKEEEQEEEE